MNICFWIGNAYRTKWGTNRIISTIANELSKTHCVTLLVDDHSSAKSPYAYSDSIEVVELPNSHLVYKQSKRSISSIICSAIRVINNKTGLFNVSSRANTLRNIYYPKKILNLFSRFINAQTYDVVIATGHEILWLAIMSDMLSSSIKTIGWQHNSYYAYVNVRNSVFWRKEALLKAYLPKLHKFVLLNDYDADIYKNQLGIDATHIYNALTLQSDIKADLSKKQFLFAGRLVQQKGIDTLIGAFNLFCQHNNDWKLVIAGDGPLRMKILKRVWASNLQARVHLVGFVENMHDYYLDCSVLLMPSRYEGWGLVVTEAFEYGLPVIAFDITPMDLMIDSGENGLLIPKENKEKFAAAMLKLANDGERRIKMGEAATQKAEMFSLDKIVAQWEALISDRRGESP